MRWHGLTCAYLCCVPTMPRGSTCTFCLHVQGYHMEARPYAHLMFTHFTTWQPRLACPHVCCVGIHRRTFCERLFACLSCPRAAMWWLRNVCVHTCQAPAQPTPHDIVWPPTCCVPAPQLSGVGIPVHALAVFPCSHRVADRPIHTPAPAHGSTGVPFVRLP